MAYLLYDMRTNDPKGGGGNHTPVRPTRPITVSLCAEFKIGLVFSRNRSRGDVLATFAASCAALRRRTRCSGVSRGGDPGGIEVFGFPDFLAAAT